MERRILSGVQFDEPDEPVVLSSIRISGCSITSEIAERPWILVTLLGRAHAKYMDCWNFHLPISS